MLLFGGIGRGGGGGGDSSRCTCLAPHPWPRLAPTRPPVPGGVAAQPRSGQLAHCLCHALVSSVRGGVGRLVGGGLHVVCARLSSGGRCGWHRRLLGTETETSSSARSVAVTSVLRLVPRQCPETFALPGERRSYPVTAPRGPRAQGSHPLSDFSPDLGFFRGGLRRR